ncbi:hypothetical protein GX411_02855 [Candidatus Fermentibacteria bacterium]|nr:hypothetical protein [Candidatus Fermentibacteria bacterium]
MERLRSRGRVAVVTAGRVQLERLERVLLDRCGMLANVEFLPTFPKLARRVLPGAVLDDEAPGELDRILMGLAAMEAVPPDLPYGNLRGSARAGSSLAAFLESLLVRGISDEEYSAALDSRASSRPATPTEESIRIAFPAYAAERRRCAPRSAESLIEEAVKEGDWARFGAIAFYGYYDMNPLQRRLLRAAARSGMVEVCCFSPLPAGLPEWGRLGTKTSELLSSMGSAPARPDARIAMGAFGNLADDLLGRRSVMEVPSGFELVDAPGTSAAARTAVDFVRTAMAAGTSAGEIAVSGRDPALRASLLLALGEGIPARDSLEAPAVSLPEGALVSGLLEAREADYHFLYLDRLVSTGALDPRFGIDRSLIAGLVSSTGCRSGLEGWIAAASSRASTDGFREFVEILAGMEAGLSNARSAGDFSRALFDSAAGLAFEGLKNRVSGLGRDLHPRFDTSIASDRMSEAIRLALSSFMVSLGGSESGVRFLPLEDLRGALFDAVCIVGVDEGIMPGIPREDARLPAELAERLELTSRKDREREEAFLLRQAMEAASKRLTLVWRSRSPDGAVLEPSLLLDPLLASTRAVGDAGGAGTPRWMRKASSSPAEALFGGVRPGQSAVRLRDGADVRLPPFFARAEAAERSRGVTSGFSAWDGDLASGGERPPIPGRVRISSIRDLAVCPFLFMLRNIWKLEEEPALELSVKPDALTFGSLVHDALRIVFAASIEGRPEPDTADAVRRSAESLGFTRTVPGGIGTVALEGVARAVDEFRGLLISSGWRPREVEKPVRHRFCGFDLTGRIDLVATDGDGREILIDFKTGRPRKRAEFLEDLTGGNEFQVPLYSIIRESEGRAPGAMGYLHLGVSPGEQPVISASEFDSFRESVLERLEVLLGMLETGLLPPKPGSACRTCSFPSVCRIWSRDRIMGFKWLNDERTRSEPLETPEQEGP